MLKPDEVKELNQLFEAIREQDVRVRNAKFSQEAAEQKLSNFLWEHTEKK